MVPAIALSYLVAGFVGSLALVFFVLKATRGLRLVAIPNSRSFHDTPTPTAGGLGFVLPLLAYLFLLAADGVATAQGLFGGVLLLAVVSLWDDFRELGAPLRLACQLLAVAMVLWFMTPTVHWVVLAVMGLAVVWHVNLFNFMDGIDGIAGCQCLLFCIGVQVLGMGIPAWQGELIWLTTGATLGFLAYNWPPAKIFMGDVGSAVLGLLLAVLVIELWRHKLVPPVACLILLAGFWFDATYTLCVRMLTGQAFTHAHRSHLYQKVAERKGHLWTTLAFVTFGVVWLMPLAWASVAYTQLQGLWLLLAVTPLAVAAVRLHAGMPSAQEA